MKSIGYTIKEELSQEAKNMLEELNNQEKLINYKKLNFKGGNNADYDFNNFSSSREILRAIYYADVSIPAVEKEQNKSDDMVKILKKYKPKKNYKYKKLTDDLVINVKNFYEGREMIINAFKDEIFPINYPNGYPYDYPPEDESLSDGEEDGLLESKDSTNRFDKLLITLDEILDPDLVEKYF